MQRKLRSVNLSCQMTFDQDHNPAPTFDMPHGPLFTATTGGPMVDDPPKEAPPEPAVAGNPVVAVLIAELIPVAIEAAKWLARRLRERIEDRRG